MNPETEQAENGKVSLWTQVEPNLAACVEAEAKDMAVSRSAVLRWALKDRYASQLALFRASQSSQEATL